MDNVPLPPLSAPAFSRRLVFLSFLLFLVFVSMRFSQLEVRPMHNDESVNAWFVMNLMRTNTYKYDPENYHGPSLYYLQVIPAWINGLFIEGIRNFHFNHITGMTDRSIRFVVVIVGLLVLLGLLASKNQIGEWGAFTAFLLAGFSCDMLYFSRYFIHEMYFVLFTLGIYLGTTYFLETGKSQYLYLMTASASLVFCTKETSIVTFFVLFMAYVCSELTFLLTSQRQEVSPFWIIKRNTFRFLREIFISQPGSLLLAVGLWYVLYSSFFSNFSGWVDSFRTYFKWTKEGVESGHVKPFIYFIKTILIPYETGLTLLACLGIMVAFLKKDKKGLFLAYWTLGIVAAYSFIPYKTPWCVLNMLLPMALVAGFGVQNIIDEVKNNPRIQNKPLFTLLIGAAVLSLALFQLPQTLKVVYKDYDLEVHPQPYVHTSRDVYNLINKIKEVAKSTGLGKSIKVNSLESGDWPLPYYLRNYPNVLFWGRYDDIGVVDAPLIVASPSQKEGLALYLKDSYQIEEYTLRPGASLNLYINEGKNVQSVPPPLPRRFEAQAVQGSLLPGLTKSVYEDRRFQGKPIEVVKGSPNIDFTWNTQKDKPYITPFSLQYEGTLKISEEGTYAFSLESDDGSWLWIDDKLVIDNGSTHPAEKKSREVFLAAGLHKVQIKYFDVGGGAILKFSWSPPDQEETTVPPAVLFHVDDPSPPSNHGKS